MGRTPERFEEIPPYRYSSAWYLYPDSDKSRRCKQSHRVAIGTMQRNVRNVSGNSGVVDRLEEDPAAPPQNRQ